MFSSLFKRNSIFVFTLVELLVVIAVIGILASLLFPALRRAKETAKEISCKANLKNMSLCHAAYQNDYDGWLIASGSPPTRWATKLIPAYLTEKTPVTICPNSPIKGTQISYAYNSELSNINTSTVRISMVKTPSRVIEYSCANPAIKRIYENSYISACLERIISPAAASQCIYHENYIFSFLDGHINGYPFKMIYPYPTGTTYDLPQFELYLNYE